MSTRTARGTITSIAPVRVLLDGHATDVPAGLVDGTSVNVTDRVNVVIRTPLKPLVLGKETSTLDSSGIFVTQAELDAQFAALTPADIGAATEADLLAEVTRATSAEGTKLAKSANLGDVSSATTARTNLGLGTAATADTGTASGQVPLLSTGGRLPIARVASGTPDGTKFVRDDGTLATPAGGGGTTVVELPFATFVKWGSD